MKRRGVEGGEMKGSGWREVGWRKGALQFNYTMYSIECICITCIVSNLLHVAMVTHTHIQFMAGRSPSSAACPTQLSRCRSVDCAGGNGKHTPTCTHKHSSRVTL